MTYIYIYIHILYTHIYIYTHKYVHVHIPCDQQVSASLTGCVQAPQSIQCQQTEIIVTPLKHK